MYIKVYILQNSTGESNMSLADGFIQVMIAVIIGVGVAVPVTSAVVTSANLTGTNALLAQFITTLIIVAIVVGIAQLV